MDLKKLNSLLSNAKFDEMRSYLESSNIDTIIADLYMAYSLYFLNPLYLDQNEF